MTTPRLTLLSALFLILALGACSTEAAAPVSTLELTTTTTVITTTTAAATTTTPPESTTTTEDPRIAEVLDDFAEYREVVLRVVLSPDEPLDQLDDFLTGDQLETLTGNLTKARAEARVFAGEFLGAVVEIRFESENRAALVECALDAVSVFSASGEVVTPADETPYFLVNDLEWSEETSRWLLADVGFQGGEKIPCEL